MVSEQAEATAPWRGCCCWWFFTPQLPPCSAPKFRTIQEPAGFKKKFHCCGSETSKGHENLLGNSKFLWIPAMHEAMLWIWMAIWSTWTLYISSKPAWFRTVGSIGWQIQNRLRNCPPCVQLHFQFLKINICLICAILFLFMNRKQVLIAKKFWNLVLESSVFSRVLWIELKLHPDSSEVLSRHPMTGNLSMQYSKYCLLLFILDKEFPSREIWMLHMHRATMQCDILPLDKSPNSFFYP